MNITRITTSPEIAGLVLRTDRAVELSGMVPITATPAAVAQGVAATAALAGAAVGGAQIGEAVD